MENTKHAIVVHFFYKEMYEEFKNYLLPLLDSDINIDLFVTVSDSSYCHLFENFKNCKVIITPNLGADVYPFLCLCKEIDFSTYTTVTKIHTKRSIESWRKELISSLMGDLKTYSSNISKFKNNPNLMIGSKKWLMKESNDNYKIYHMERFETYCLVFRGRNMYFNENASYFQGTMFMTSGSYIKNFTSNIIELIDLFQETKSNNMLSHAFERIIGFEISENNGTYIGV